MSIKNNIYQVWLKKSYLYSIKNSHIGVNLNWKQPINMHANVVNKTKVDQEIIMTCGWYILVEKQ